jgi:hypothetical protein
MSTTQQMTAVPRNSSGTAITGKTITWSSSFPSIATVNSSGLVTAQGPGFSTITATVDGVTGTATANVTSPVAQSYRIDEGDFNNSFGLSTIQQGTSDTRTLYVTRSGGYTGSITVTAPTGVTGITVTVGASTASLGSSVVLANGVTEFYVRLTVDASATVGTRAVNISSTGPGSLSSNHIMQVNVSATPVFSVTGVFNPTSVNVARGGTATATLTITRNGGYTGVVSLSNGGGTLRGAFPFDNPGTISFSPAIIGAGATTATVTLSLPTGWTSGPVSGSQFVNVTLTPETGDPRNVALIFNPTN